MPRLNRSAHFLVPIPYRPRRRYPYKLAHDLSVGLGGEDAASSPFFPAGLDVAAAVDAWNALTRFGEQSVIPTVPSMSFLNELDPLVEGY